jgi:hypothetical protein
LYLLAHRQRMQEIQRLHEEQMRDEAAVRIQSAARGHQARVRVSDMKQQRAPCTSDSADA